MPTTLRDKIHFTLRISMIFKWLASIVFTFKIQITTKSQKKNDYVAGVQAHYFASFKT